MMHTLPRSFALGAFLAAGLLPAHTVAAQSQTFDPFAGTKSSTYRFDLSRTLFASPAIELRERETTFAIAERARALSARAAGSANVLYAMLATQDSAQLRLARHYAYLSLRLSLHAADSAASNGIADVARREQTGLGPVTGVLNTLSEREFAAHAARLPALRRYAFAATRARAAARAPLRDATGSARALQRTINDGPVRFRATLARTDFGTVQAPEGQLAIRTQMGTILSHQNRAVREAGYRQNYARLGAIRDTFASIMVDVAAARNTLAKRNGFADYREESYAERYLTMDDVRGILGTLERASDVHKRYERLRIARIRALHGFATVHSWDLGAPPPGRMAPRFTITEATAIAVASARPLGALYATELRSVLDPRNGRIDLDPRPGRAERPGFSTGRVGYPSHFFQGRYNGLLDDVVILVHEAGHAAQNMMMDRRGVLPRYAFGPGYFTESYAALSELVVMEHLVRTTTDRPVRIQHLERLIDQAVEMFRSASEAAFEDRVYADVAAGRRHSAETLERLFHETAAPYSVWFGAGSERTLAWVQPLQFYTWPLYRLNYVLAKLLALNYIDQLHADPARFQQRYESLLSRGYDATPHDLLRDEMAIDIGDTAALVARATSVIRRWVDELEALYRE